MMFSFEVGKRERHRVVYEDSKLTSTSKITIDGIPIQKKFRMYISSKEEFNFEVGGGEKHDVRILIKRPFLARGLRAYKYDVFIDGKLYNTYEG